MIVDIIVVVLLVVALIAGLQRGLLTGLGSVLGLVGGGVAAFWLMPLVGGWVPWQGWRTVAVIVAGVALLALGLTIGEGIGALMRRGVDRTRLRGVERLLGGVVNVVAAALTLMLVAPTVASMTPPAVSTSIASSRVLQELDRLTPAAVNELMAQMRTAVLSGGVPELRLLLDSGSTMPEPSVSLDDPDLQAAAASVARISGTAYACGVGSSGTGFVIAPDRVVTNAHVVAGVDNPVVELPGRSAREGRIVYFDPIDDLAVIAVDDLRGTPLKVAPALPAGAAAAIEGYPYGGPFRSVTAGVLSVGTAQVPDIYDRSSAPRDVYALDAQVVPGNSGGPLLAEDGTVVGVVFARGTDRADRGYAMTSTELTPVVDGAEQMDAAVPSGQCAG